jgi:hypothetical protein
MFIEARKESDMTYVYMVLLALQDFLPKRMAGNGRFMNLSGFLAPP